MNNRFQAQQNARLALDKLRREIHCTSATAKGTDGTALAAATAYSSVRFTLPSYCPTNPTVTSATPETAYATWCTALVSTGRYQLWRYVTTNAGDLRPDLRSRRHGRDEGAVGRLPDAGERIPGLHRAAGRQLVGADDGLHGGAAREAHRHDHVPLPVQRHRRRYVRRHGADVADRAQRHRHERLGHLQEHRRAHVRRSAS